MFAVIKNPGNIRVVSSDSSEVIVAQLKTLGVKGIDKKKTPKSWKRGSNAYKGAGNSDVVVMVS